MEKFEKINADFKKLANQNIHDLERIFSYISTFHSTAIEGSTLTQNDTSIFLEHQIPIKGKPMLHHDMVRDYFNAYQFLKNHIQNKPKFELSIDFIKQINRLVMKNSGSIVHNALGTIDTGNGEIRNFAVRAGTGGYYMAHNKVESALIQLIKDVNKSFIDAKTTMQKHHLAFDLHYNFVTIHPFGDGNGRTSRLLMNFVQMCFGEPLSIVFVEDKVEYIKALMETREKEDISIFRTFMEQQHVKFLENEIALAQKEHIQKKPFDKGMTFFF